MVKNKDKLEAVRINWKACLSLPTHKLSATADMQGEAGSLHQEP